MVCHNFDLWFHCSGAHHHAVQLHQRSHTAGCDLAQLHRLARVAWQETNVEVVLQPNRNSRRWCAIRTSCRALACCHTLAPLHNDILCRASVADPDLPVRQLSVASLIEVPDVPCSIRLNVRHPLLNGLLQLDPWDLLGVSDRLIWLQNLLLAELFHIVEVNEDRLQLPVGCALQQGLVLFVTKLGIRSVGPLLEIGNELSAQCPEFGEPLRCLSGPHEVVPGDALTHRVGRHHLQAWVSRNERRIHNAACDVAV
mmetsp:Transcript_99991/g.250684  ORF Transcript_99991/g.250684 Transcript_99991/m.250684 type:complete len:255 (+) Transcript_99991:1999-2763(+)